MKDEHDPFPPFVKPGDNPELDALLAKLREDGEDPFHPEFERKRPGTAAQQKAAEASDAPVSKQPRRIPMSWIVVGAVLLAAPAAMLLGFALMRMNNTTVQVGPAPTQPQTGTAPATAVVMAPSLEVDAGIGINASATSTTTPSVHAPQPTPPTQPTQQTDAGAAEEDAGADASTATPPHGLPPLPF